MVGVLLITHGSLGEELLAAAAHVLGGEQAHVRAIGVAPSDDQPTVWAAARGALAEIDQGDGVIVFSDIYGATPCNTAARLVVSGRVECVAGVNLPMLVKTLAYRALPIEQVLARAKDAGEQGQIDLKEEMAHAAAGRS